MRIWEIAKSVERRNIEDRMGLRIYWELCRKNGVNFREKSHEVVPDEV